MKKATLLMVFLFIACLSLLFLFLLNNYNSPAHIPHVIVLSEEGFSPSSLTINQGDTVKFTTSRNTPFWPASDLHPTHGIYPEFDPQEPIEPNADWQFTFNKKGPWRYHDHLAPYYRGTITVQ